MPLPRDVVLAYAGIDDVAVESVIALTIVAGLVTEGLLVSCAKTVGR